jgi:excisionase family DNA binding protein
MDLSQSELLTVSEVAGLLRVSPAAVRVWVAQRKLSSVSVGRLVRIRKSAVEAYVKRNEKIAAGDKEPGQ